MDHRKNVRQQIKDFLTPVLIPTDQHDVTRWQRGLYILLGIEIVRFAYSFITSLGAFYSQGYDYDSLITMVYLLLVIYLVHRRHRWGWVLLFVYGSLTAITAAYYVISLLFTDAGNKQMPYYLLALFIYSAVTTFLWKPGTTGFFNVSKKLRRRTLIFILVILGLVVTVAILARCFLGSISVAV